MTEPETIEAEVEEIMDNLPAVRASQAIIARDEISVPEIVAQREKIVQVMDAVMTRNIHYGIIPGVSKPSLFKPGAETLCVALRIAPHYVSEKIWHEDGHLTVSVVCTLKHIPTGLEIATGEGLCTSRESRYAYRQAKRICPVCGTEAIIKGKAEYGGGWVCFKKQGGCGAKFLDGDGQIESQEIGKVPNPELPDTFNTVLKMADKRALIAAVLNGTAASDVFTQDVEDGTPPPDDTPAPEKVVEGPEPLALPRSWAKVTEYVSAYDEATHDLFYAFAESARELQFGTRVKRELTPGQKSQELKVAGDAAIALRNMISPSAFPPPNEDDIRAAWASVLEGQELAIPEAEDVDPA